ncbi:hypothetical protein AKJ09_07110 [Labilithrix luteola]|uniref:Lipoprotein n=1 Tax=Labilithrix luteola TaxID=1391654 RepID=A0A0K1Q476_9BACT|nr:hypothetical protein [Labilithrix luteola]AKV00447.1 hypothetical protein AKJ09_07110 [Labilithrix luteola]
MSKRVSPFVTRFLLPAGIALAATQMGCASQVWNPRVESVSGEHRNTGTITAQAQTLLEGTADEQVKAIVGQLPPGISLKDGVLSVDEDRYEVLGKVEAEPNSDFFYPYREKWRRPVCYPQRVLLVATLFVWAAVPTSWPCFVSSGSVEENRDRAVESLKRATKVLGGNLVLVTGFGLGSVAWAIRVKDGAKAPVEDKAPGTTL